MAADVGRYRLTWDPARLAWVLSHGRQEWASICAYLPGRPPMTERLARAWVDGLVGPLDWPADGAARAAAAAT